MMHTTDGLYKELNDALIEVEKQLKHIKNDIQLQYPGVDPGKLGVAYWTRLPDGSYVLERLLAAKAQLLSGMAALKAADLASKTPKKR